MFEGLCPVPALQRVSNPLAKQFTSDDADMKANTSPSYVDYGNYSSILGIIGEFQNILNNEVLHFRRVIHFIFFQLINNIRE